MPTLERVPIRIEADAAAPDTKKVYPLWRGTSVDIDVAIFKNALLVSVANVAALHLEVKAFGPNRARPTENDPAYIQAELAPDDLDDTTDLTSWKNGSRRHARFSLSPDETNAPTAGEYHLVIWADLDGGDILPLHIARLEVREDGGGLASVPIPPSETYFNTNESDARYLQQAGNLAEIADPAAALLNLGAFNQAEADLRYLRKEHWHFFSVPFGIGSIVLGPGFPSSLKQVSYPAGVMANGASAFSVVEFSGTTMSAMTFNIALPPILKDLTGLRMRFFPVFTLGDEYGKYVQLNVSGYDGDGDDISTPIDYAGQYNGFPSWSGYEDLDQYGYLDIRYEPEDPLGVGFDPYPTAYWTLVGDRDGTYNVNDQLAFCPSTAAEPKWRYPWGRGYSWTDFAGSMGGITTTNPGTVTWVMEAALVHPGEEASWPSAGPSGDPAYFAPLTFDLGANKDVPYPVYGDVSDPFRLKIPNNAALTPGYTVIQGRLFRDPAQTWPGSSDTFQGKVHLLGLGVLLELSQLDPLA